MFRIAAPERVETARLVLKRPTVTDVPAMFDRYASDPVVTRYLAWPRHTSLADTRLFVAFSDAEWARTGCGPYLAFSADEATLLGSTGLTCESLERVSTGYAFARDAWGQGYATEALHAMVDLAASLGVLTLHAICHIEHRTSSRVMEKCGFHRQGILRRHIVFPNLSLEPADVLHYSRACGSVESVPA